MERRRGVGWATSGDENDQLDSASSESSSSGAAAADENQEIIPKPNDVLMGRGLPFQAHPGTQLMRRIVAEHRETYKSMPRQSRGEVANKILRTLKSKGCRFLVRRNKSARNRLSGGWDLATEGEAYDKVCHALRSKIGQTRPGTGEGPGLDSSAENRQIEETEAEDAVQDTASTELFSEQTSSANATGGEDARLSSSEPCLNDLVYTNLAVRMAIDEYLRNKKDS